MSFDGRAPYQKDPTYRTKRKKGDDKMREAAQGQNCALRLGCCNHDPATTVLAHLRMFGWAGTAQKPPDFLGVFACSECHDALDRRNRATEWGYDDVLRALGETLIIQSRMGNLK